MAVGTYIWRTQQDDRVRPRHADREGKLYRWDSPPSGGSPGEDYNCRCFAELPTDGDTEGLDQFQNMSKDEIRDNLTNVKTILGITEQ